MSGAALTRMAQESAMAEIFAAETRSAIDSGVFGAPTYVVEGELFWGQDRLEFVDAALSRHRA
jgi:carboxymethylenebutenolidase